MDIKPGTSVKVELTHLPSSERAVKTIVRLFRKDADVIRLARSQKDKRPSWQKWRRGNKMWHHQMKSRAHVNLTTGATYTFHASVDVLRDLESVKRFVKVSKA